MLGDEEPDGLPLLFFEGEAAGEVSVKLGWLGERLVSAVPEYEACRRLAESSGMPLRRVYELAQAAAASLLSGTDGQ